MSNIQEQCAAGCDFTMLEQRVINLLAEKNAKLGHCPRCQQDVWGLTGIALLLLPAYDKGHVTPVYVMTCMHCGHLEMFDPIQLGLTWDVLPVLRKEAYG